MLKGDYRQEHRDYIGHFSWLTYPVRAPGHIRFSTIFLVQALIVLTTTLNAGVLHKNVSTCDEYRTIMRIDFYGILCTSPRVNHLDRVLLKLDTPLLIMALKCSKLLSLTSQIIWRLARCVSERLKPDILLRKKNCCKFVTTKDVPFFLKDLPYILILINISQC